MKFRTTAILAFVLLGVAIFVYFATRNGPDDSTSSTTDNKSSAGDTKGKKLFDIAADKLDHLTIHPTSGADIEMSKAGFEWKLTKPVDWPADSSAVTKIVSAITDLRSRGGIELNSANLASSGLDHPQFVISASGAGKSLKLEVGNQSALGNDLYVKADDNKQGELVPGGALGGSLAGGIDKLIESLRDKKLIATAQSSIQQVEIDRNSAKLALEKSADKNGGDKWKVVQPAQVNAETSEVSSLLDDVTGLSAGQFSTESAAQEAGAKLNEPRLKIRFSTLPPAVGSPAPTTAPFAGPSTIIAIGQPVDIEAQKAWVKITSPDRPVVVAQATFSKSTFDKLKSASVMSVRDRNVTDIDADSVAKFTLAINKPATTQPTTQPAEVREFTIERHKEKPPVLGPALPAGLTVPTTQPSSPTTQPAIATTQPSVPATQPDVATTQPATPATQPAIATTQPSSPTTQPVAATTQPDEAALAKWIFTSGGTGPADEGQVTELLGALHPLRAEKYLEPGKATGAIYVLTIHTIPAKGTEHAEDVVLTFVETDKRIDGYYKDLHFEVSRNMLEKLTGDFKTKKAAPPEMPPSMRGGGSPFGGGGLPFGG